MMKKFEGVSWGNIAQEEKALLLQNAVCRDVLFGTPMNNGEGLIEFSETLAVMGEINNGEIKISNKSVLYNPCIGENGPMSQGELDSMLSSYREDNVDDLNKRVYEFEKNLKNSLHVVLLGAGASVAAIPNGDKNGKKISAMKGFIAKLEMQDIIATVNLKTTSDNLEDIYMEMYERKDCDQQRKQLEEAIEKYFSEFELPDEPTTYDFLLLSLTKKDLVATFNWDPLLVEAYTRCSKITTNLPQLAFLHGNIAIATCEKDNVLGGLFRTCPHCGKMLKKVPLLYPIRNKNYESNPYISAGWKQLEHYLQHAYRLTLFGYSAPKSDVAAISMLKKAWGKVKDRSLEEIEIIDIRSEDEVVESWSDFIHTHHYSVINNIFESALGKFPRRTCELLFDNTQKNRWMHGNRGFSRKMSFEEIRNHLKKLIDNENSDAEILDDPYVE